MGWMIGPAISDAALSGHLVKRSVSLRGHRTSLALEPVFWAALDEAAAQDGVPVAALIALVDDERAAGGAPLSSALRVWLFERRFIETVLEPTDAP